MAQTPKASYMDPHLKDIMSFVPSTLKPLQSKESCMKSQCDAWRHVAVTMSGPLRVSALREKVLSMICIGKRRTKSSQPLSATSTKPTEISLDQVCSQF